MASNVPYNIGPCLIITTILTVFGYGHFDHTGMYTVCSTVQYVIYGISNNNNFIPTTFNLNNNNNNNNI